MANLTKKQIKELENIQRYLRELETFINDNLGMAHTVNNPNGGSFQIVNKELATPNNHTTLQPEYIGYYSKNGSPLVYAGKAKTALDSFVLRNIKQEQQRPTMKQAIAHLDQLERDNVNFFWSQLMPALEQYGMTGAISINPPIVGAMTATGSFDNPERALNLFNYWNQ